MTRATPDSTPQSGNTNNVTSTSGESTKSRIKSLPRGPPSKVVVRRLPPSMTQDVFVDQVSPLPEYDYLYFVKADLTLGQNAFSRAYINFLTDSDIFIFKDKFDGYVFVDQKGIEYPAIVEFSPFQRVPKKRTKKKDLKCATIDQDPDYIKFLESLENPEEIVLPSAETCLEAIEAKEKELKEKGGSMRVTTPLLDYVRQRKLDRIRMKEEKREERRRKDVEKRKQREDERIRRRDREIKEREREKEMAKAKEKDKTGKTKDPKLRGDSKDIRQRGEHTSAQTRVLSRESKKSPELDEQQQLQEGTKLLKELLHIGESNEKPDGNAKQVSKSTEKGAGTSEMQSKQEKVDAEHEERQDSEQTDRHESGRTDRHEAGRAERQELGRNERHDSGRNERRESERNDKHNSGRNERPAGREFKGGYKDKRETNRSEMDRRANRREEERRYRQNKERERASRDKREDKEDRRTRYAKPSDRPPRRLSAKETNEREKTETQDKSEKVKHESDKAGKREDKVPSATNSKSPSHPNEITGETLSGQTPSDPTSSEVKQKEKKTKETDDKADKEERSNKMKDPRLERRIRNKDRPTLEIYRPGMGRMKGQNKSEDTESGKEGSQTPDGCHSPVTTPTDAIKPFATGLKSIEHGRKTHGNIDGKGDNNSCHNKGFHSDRGESRQSSIEDEDKDNIQRSASQD